MVKKIIISYFNSVAAILNHNRIQEIVIINNDYQVNDIYFGIVHKIFSGINAAFIKLGKYGKSGFIHLNDIKPLRRNKKITHISEVLSINQLILVQVIKEPTLNKGPRLTANIHLHGKYIVLMPFCNIILISHRIYDNNERIYLHSLAVLMKPKLMGLLIKSSAQGVSESVILKDLSLLINQWYFIQKTIIITSAPSLIYKDEDLIKKVIRDFYENSVQKIVIDSEDGLKFAYYYLKKWSCISDLTTTKLQLYNRQNSILDKFYIKQAIREALRPKVKLKYGGYIIIENYEALTVIDVNSGSFNRPDNSRETILRINFYAAIEIAYQLRVRNLNGVIIIDFIDMHYQRDQLKLLEHFNKLLILDEARPQIVQLSELGLLELTRMRRGQSLKEIFSNNGIINLNHPSFCFTNHIYFKLFFRLSHQYLERKLLINKNIRSLFFNKKFHNNKVLENKYFLSDLVMYQKYFIFIDHLYSIYLFNTKANYLVPIVYYAKLMKYHETKLHFVCFS
uniref:Ribonuclease E n=1 Tax=Alsidium seaforthii TaxID=2007182 RepID=A0A1Z1MDG5_9FLOR|nr:ribonuclease E [Bryothamnion seaforthii]ARW63855.1 ribonuclease E [Bryothamnion seaforthii]